MKPLLLLAFITICTLSGKAQQYPFVYYTPKDGLINSRVKSMKQDSYGRMHFLTFGGLSIYDGTRFINYTTDDGLANSLVNDLAELTPDSFWVATNTRRLNTLVRGRVGTFQTADGYCPTINRFFRSRDGRWYATADEGLFLFSHRKFTRLPMRIRGTEVGREIDRILEYRDWLVILPWNPESAEKLMIYHRPTGRTSALGGVEAINDLQTDRGGAIWLITATGRALGLDTAALNSGTIRLLPPPVRHPGIRTSSRNIYFDRSGGAWLYGGTHLQQFSKGGAAAYITPEQGLKTGNIVQLLEDREGVFWLATDGGGVVKLNNTHIQLLNALGPRKPMDFSALQQKGDTTWLYSNSEHAVYRLNGGDTSRFHLPGSMEVNNLYAIGEQLYLAGWKDLLLVRHKDDPASYRQPETVIRLDEYFLTRGVPDPYGNLIQYMGTKEGRFLTVVSRDKIIHRFRVSHTVDQMLIDRRKLLWLTTRDGRLMALSLHPSAPATYLRPVHDFREGFSDMDFRSLAIDSQDNIWAGTRYKGLYRFRLQGGNLRVAEVFTMNRGLTDNFVTYLYADSQTLWVGTQTGIDKMVKRNGQFALINTGRNNNYFQHVAQTAVAPDGTAWVLNEDGTVLRIAAQPSLRPPPPPPLLITGIKVNNRPLGPGLSSFGHNENNFVFQVAAPSFMDEKSVRYSYWLEGSGSRIWSDPSNLSTFAFTGLPPGRYRLHVRAEFPEALYPVQTTSYTFHIAAPWWQTGWFIFTAVVLAATGSILLIRSYYRARWQKQRLLFEKQQAVEQERTRIASDIHDDLGAGLSTIRFLSEKLKQRSLQEGIRAEADKIAVNSNELVQKMNEIIWAMNEKNDTLEDLLFYTRSYAVAYCEEHELLCEVSIPEDMPALFVSGEWRRNVFLLVKECLHNVVKHAGARKVCITFGRCKHLEVVIQDDGRGISGGKTGNGLGNIRQRVERIGGSLTLENRNGLRVRACFPLTPAR